MTYSDPADRIAAVTPSDTTDLTGARGIRCGGTGNLSVRMVNAPTVTVTIVDILPGELLPLRVTRVMAATTATDITAFF